MRWFLGQLALNFLKMSATFAGIFLLAIWGWKSFKSSHNAKADRPEYALEVFTPLLLVGGVLASREYHPIGANFPYWDCTYAVIELGADPPQIPPSATFDDGINWRFRFGGTWHETPAPALRETTRSALDFCSQYFTDEVTKRLQRALANPGSWYMRDHVGENLHIYSLPQNIAARIRFGD